MSLASSAPPSVVDVLLRGGGPTETRFVRLEAPSRATPPQVARPTLLPNAPQVADAPHCKPPVSEVGLPRRSSLEELRRLRVAMVSPALGGVRGRAWEAIAALTEGPVVGPDALAEAARAALILGETEAASWLLRRGLSLGSEEARLLEAWSSGADRPPEPTLGRGSSGQEADDLAGLALWRWRRGDERGAREALAQGRALRPGHAELAGVGEIIDRKGGDPRGLLPRAEYGWMSLERWRRRIGGFPAPVEGESAWATLYEDGITQPCLYTLAGLSGLPPIGIEVEAERAVDRLVSRHACGRTLGGVLEPVVRLGAALAETPRLRLLGLLSNLARRPHPDRRACLRAVARLGAAPANEGG